MTDTNKKKLYNIITAVIILVIIIAAVIVVVKNNSSKKSDSISTSGSTSSTSFVNATEKGEYTCTVEIDCKTILSNMQNLDSSKSKYVPPDGMIASDVTVSFDDGDTVFDVLKKTCTANNIQLEYSSTLASDVYIEGIDNLYEFDCGKESGWMFYVNGKSSGVSCSAYKLSDNDKIEWRYTCNGMGADTAGENNE